MKKMLWMAALTSVALAGCVNEEVAVDNPAKQRKELTFGTPVMYNQSRSVNGEILGTTYPTGENFVVFAVETTEGNFKGWTADNVAIDENNSPITFFPSEGVTVQHGTSGHWHITGDIKYHWPDDSGHKLTFAAYSPARTKDAATSISYDDTGLTVTDFKISAKASEQYDLMYSTRTVDATASPVAINFKHALSSIRFAFVKPAEGSAEIIRIKKLELLGNIFNKGTFEQKIAANSPSSSGSPVWDVRSYEKDGDDDIVYTLFEGEWEVPASEGAEISNISSFLPIPQHVTSEMKVRLTYDTKQNATDAAYSDVDPVVIPFTDFIIPNTNPASHITAWEMGKRYIYHIHFGALKEIFFAPTIAEDWTTVGEAGIYIVSSGSNDNADGDNDSDGDAVTP